MSLQTVNGSIKQSKNQSLSEHAQWPFSFSRWWFETQSSLSIKINNLLIKQSPPACSIASFILSRTGWQPINQPNNPSTNRFTSMLMLISLLRNIQKVSQKTHQSITFLACSLASFISFSRLWTCSRSISQSNRSSINHCQHLLSQLSFILSIYSHASDSPPGTPSGASASGCSCPPRSCSGPRSWCDTRAQWSPASRRSEKKLEG